MARPVFRTMQVAHRWMALILGTLLLLIVLSGCVLLFKDQIHRTLHPSLFKATETAQPIGFERAARAAGAPELGLKPVGVQLKDGIYEVYTESGSTVMVDGGTGRVNGTKNDQQGVFGLLDNLHECALSCEGYTWYVPALAKPVGFGLLGEELTWGALLLGGLGVVLGLLVISGLVVWWPGIRSMARGFTIRRGKKSNTYKFNYDLHKVVGAVALPFLAVWALTGAGFEFPVVGKAWYAALPGSAPEEPVPLESKPVKGATVSMDEAVAIAERRLEGGEVGYVGLPDRTDPKSVWDMWVSYGNDPYDHGLPGNAQVQVDRYSGATKTGYGAPGFTDTAAEGLWENWNFGIHAGTPVNGWWRIGWLIFGLTPLLLAVTGVTTWWIRRGKAKRKKRMKAERARQGGGKRGPAITGEPAPELVA